MILSGDNMEMLDGRKVKEEILAELENKIRKLDHKLLIAVIQIGDDPASNVYIRNKKKLMERLDIGFKLIKLREDISTEEVITVIDELNSNDMITGIMVQLPISDHLDSNIIINRIDPKKDIDGLTDLNIGKIVHTSLGIIPCTVRGILELIKYYHISLAGKCVVIVGRSNIVGRPLANILSNYDATVILCHSKTEDLKKYTKMADILIVSIGKARMITDDYVKEGAIVVDVGINRVDDDTLCGDVDFDSVSRKVSYITPVPGGVGQMTLASLALNIYEIFINNK